MLKCDAILRHGSESKVGVKESMWNKSQIHGYEFIFFGVWTLPDVCVRHHKAIRPVCGYHYVVDSGFSSCDMIGVTFRHV